MSGISVTVTCNMLAEKRVGIFLGKGYNIGKGGFLQMAHSW